MYTSDSTDVLTKLLGKDSPGPDHVDALVFPLPYEGTVSFGGGTADGPQKIIDIASEQVEFYDYELECFPCKEKGIYTAPCEPINGSPQEAHEEIIKRTCNLFSSENKRISMRDGIFPVALGGEHAITFPFIKGLMQAGVLPKDIGILQIDAHSDLRNAYEDNPLSHASVMRRLRDDLKLHSVHVGIRAIGDDEPEYITKNNVPVFFAPFTTDQIPAIIQKLPENIFISFDVDALDPSIMPSTGTPVPGGLLWFETLALLRVVFTEKNVMAMDIVELSPIEGLHAPDFLIAQLLYKCMAYKFYLS